MCRTVQSFGPCTITGNSYSGNTAVGRLIVGDTLAHVHARKMFSKPPWIPFLWDTTCQWAWTFPDLRFASGRYGASRNLVYILSAVIFIQGRSVEMLSDILKPGGSQKSARPPLLSPSSILPTSLSHCAFSLQGKIWRFFFSEI
jgi:hypothetical protein